MRASRSVKTVLVGSTLFLSGCSGCVVRDDVYVERRVHDGVPIVYSPMPGYYWSPYYSGYVPIIVPIGGYSNGNTYITHYNSLPPEKRRTVAAPVQTAKTVNNTTINNYNSTSKSTPISNTRRGIAGGTGAGTVSS